MIHFAFVVRMIRNPKSKTQNPNKIQNVNFKILTGISLELCALNLRFYLDLGFRALGFLWILGFELWILTLG